MCKDHRHAHHSFGYRARSPKPVARPTLRIAVIGKGGAGKTTVSGALARALAGRGLRVLAIDADPDANLASALPLDKGEQPVPLAQQKELLNTVNAGQTPLPGLFLLNPETRELLPQGTVTWGGGQPLVALGWSKNGGEGCYCAEHALLRQLLSKASKAEADVTVIDSEAGLEHLSRGTIAGIDVALVVIEPGRRSLETAAAVRQLAASLDIAQVHTVVSGCRTPEEMTQVLEWLHDSPPLAIFPFDEAIRLADLYGTVPELRGEFLRAAETLAEAVLQLPLKAAA